MFLFIFTEKKNSQLGAQNRLSQNKAYFGSFVTKLADKYLALKCVPGILRGCVLPP